MRIPLCLLLAGLAVLPAAAAPASSKDVVNILKTKRIDLEFEAVSLEGLVDYFRTATGLNIVVNKGAIEKEGGDPDALEFTIKVQNVSVGAAMKLAFEPYDLALKIKKNILFVTGKRDARGEPVLVLYSVADVLMEIRDFPAPDINIYPSSYEPPEPIEPEISRAVESADELAELVRQFTGQDTWEDEGIRLSVFRKHLMIRQYPEVHRQIQRFLSAVRALR